MARGLVFLSASAVQNDGVALPSLFKMSPTLVFQTEVEMFRVAVRFHRIVAVIVDVFSQNPEIQNIKVAIAVNILNGKVVVGRGVQIGVTIVIVRLQLFRNQLKLDIFFRRHILIDSNTCEAVSENIRFTITIKVLENHPIMQIREKVAIRGRINVCHTVLQTEIQECQQTVAMFLKKNQIVDAVVIKVKLCTFHRVDASRPRKRKKLFTHGMNSDIL